MAPDRSDAGRLRRRQTTVHFDRDGSWQRFGRVVIAGSPLTIFRTSAAAAPILDALESGDDVAGSHLTDRLLEAGAIHPRLRSAERHAGGVHRHADVTVVTPQFGGRATLDGRLTVDDGSDPPISGAARRLDTNRGPAAARNAGRELAATALIAFVDADVDVLDDIGVESWLDPLLPHFADPMVGLVAPRVAGEPGSPLDLGDQPARIRAGTRVSYAPGAALVVRAAAFDDVGGFDEKLRFGEDVDFVWRLDQAGWRCRYEPATVVWHEPRRTLTGRLRQHAGYGTSAAPLALRHPDALSPVRTNGWTATAWGCVAAGHPVIGAVTAVGSAGALIPRLRDIPPRAAFTLAMSGHLRAARQFASALRRVWWPLAAAAALCSRRARIVVAAAIVLDAPATPTDVAYGCGVWRGMWAHRTLLPIMPRLSPWPNRRN